MIGNLQNCQGRNRQGKTEDRPQIGGGRGEVMIYCHTGTLMQAWTWEVMQENGRNLRIQVIILCQHECFDNCTVGVQDGSMLKFSKLTPSGMDVRLEGDFFLGWFLSSGLVIPCFPSPAHQGSVLPCVSLVNPDRLVCFVLTECTRLVVIT